MNKRPFVLFCATLVLLSPTFAQAGCGNPERKSTPTSAPTDGNLAAAQSKGSTRRIVFTKASFGSMITNSVLTLDDLPDHKLTQSFRMDTGRTTDADFVITQELVYGQSDERPGKAPRYYGYSTYLMQGGDKVFIKWESDSVPQGPVVGEEPTKGSGNIVILGGTGRFKNIQGRGVWHEFAKGPVVEENILDISW
jgi:hypothetical protein